MKLTDGGYSLWGYGEACKIVGNIHEDKELLDGKNEQKL